jgi:limonene-1,2-epoxide hydrolase
MKDLTTRRQVMMLGGSSVLASAVPISFAEAKREPLSDREKTNVAMVKAYLKSCNAVPFDAEQIVKTYFDPKASVRWTDDAPPSLGAEAALADAKSLMSPGATLDIKLLDVFAKGQLVATSRIDTFKVPGKPDTSLPVAGVHIIKDGKFIEYVDYIVK